MPDGNLAAHVIPEKPRVSRRATAQHRAPNVAADTIETPIVQLARRIAAASKLSASCDEADDVDGSDTANGEACDAADTLIELAPQTLTDAVVLLMAATTYTRTGSLAQNGTYLHEWGDIIVRRVIRFLASHSRIDLDDIGGTFFFPLTNYETLAHEGTVAEAAAHLNNVDASKARYRHDHWQATLHRDALRANWSPDDHARIVRLVDEASARLAAMPDNHPSFAAGREMLKRAGMEGFA